VYSTNKYKLIEPPSFDIKAGYPADNTLVRVYEIDPAA
jgi:hypothetical protein